MLQESAEFAESVEALIRQSLGIPLDEKVTYDDDDEPAAYQQIGKEEEEAEEEEAEKEESPEHEEL